MKKIFVALCMVAFLAACGDDSSSASAGQNDDLGIESSSSVEQGSSSSGKAKSSSSVIASETKQSSSSSSVDPVSSSSFHGDKKSSSSTDDASSSSKKLGSSSSVGRVNCSALLEDGTGWSWDVPNECRFNPDIDYGSMTDSRDGKKYKTVTIGDQVWMAENLNYVDSAKTPSLKRKSWCYNNEAKNCDVVGRLYTWAAAIDSVKLANDTDNPQDCGNGRECGLTGKVQGICPSGWHLPSNEEWKALFTAVGGQSNAGKVLKSLTGWYSNGNGTDAFGFSALPAGDRYYSGGFDYDGYHAYFWSATEDNSGYAYSMFLYYYSELAYLGDGSKNYGFSVRCLKD